MPILDSQVHAYERNHLGRPWIGTLYGPPEATGDQMVTAMDAVGVDGAILVSPFSMYRYDASYALEVFAAHPTRFRLIKPVDPTDPTVVDTIADWASTDGTVGIRIFLRDNASTDPADPAINRVLATAARHSLPVNVACTGRLALGLPPGVHSMCPATDRLPHGTVWASTPHRAPMSSARIGGGSLTGICSDGKPGMCCSHRRLSESRRIHTPRSG